MSQLVTEEAWATGRNLSGLLLLKLLQYPFVLLFLLIVPRLLGPVDYGEFALLISIIMIAGSVSDLAGSSELFTRFVPEFEAQGQRAHSNELYSKVLFLQTAVTLAFAALLFPALQHMYGDRFASPYFALICLILLVRNQYSCSFSFLFGLNALVKTTVPVPLRRVLTLTFLVACYRYFGLIGVLVSTLLTDLCLSALSLLWTFENFSWKAFRLDLQFLRPFFGYALTFYLAAGLMTIWHRLGNVLIEHWTQDPQQVALFDIPNQIFLLIQGLISASCLALAPIFTKLRIAGREEKVTEWARLGAKYLGIFVSLSFWGFAVSGRPLLGRLLGPEYASAYDNGVIQLLSLFPTVLTCLGVLFCLIRSNPVRYVSVLVLTVGTMVSASALLLPSYGVLGCAAAMSASAAVQAAGMYWAAREELGPSLRALLASVACSSVFAPALLLGEELAETLLVFSGFAAVYAAVLFATRTVRWDELTSMWRVLRARPETVSSLGRVSAG